MSEPKDHLKFQYAELDRLKRDLAALERWGVSVTDPGYQNLMEATATAYEKIGLLRPRLTTLVSTRRGLSPGEIKLFADAELGWMAESRVKPGAQPVYKYVSDDIAEKVVKGVVTKELEEFLMTPDDYIGE